MDKPSHPAHDTGMRGEEAAVRYLEASGYHILQRNMRFGRYEIDIVAYDRQEDTLVFAEVKTRSSQSEAYPIRTAVDGRKRRAMREAISRYRHASHDERPGRIDVISMLKDRVVEHLKDVGSDFA